MAKQRDSNKAITNAPPLPPVTPMEVDAVRRRALAVVRKNFPKVNEVLDGKLQWSNQQIKLFQICLDKIAPDIKVSHATHEHYHTEVSELTHEQLMEIASRTEPVDADYTEIEATTIDPSMADATSDILK
tara:strand:- start:351 stop:740 length:390 start_codon:yes stop_codon:yes gene_type:complete